MNKTLMLVICDFLLLSMLAMARFDRPEAPPDPLAARGEAASEAAELIEVLELSLEAEMEQRTGLKEDLSETRADLEARAAELAEREAALEQTRRELSVTVSEAERLARDKRELEAERARLEESAEAARQSLAEAADERTELVRDLGSLQETAAVTQERLRRTEEDLARREAELAERAAEVDRLAAERESLRGEREQIARRLEVAETEKTLLARNLENERLEKEIVRREKERAVEQAERLGEGVGALAEKSENILEEIEKSRPLTMSEIFTRFKQNRVTIRFDSRRRGVFGERTEVHEMRSIVVNDGTGAYILVHEADTPFRFSAGGLLGVSVEVTFGSGRYPVPEVGFFANDPRILFIPLPASSVAASGLKPFPLSLEPERFEEAVLVSNDERNFGRSEFRRLPESERFLRMDRPVMGELFADFAPSRGDFVFSKNGGLIGLMANAKHAAVVKDFLASGTVKLGTDFDPAVASDTLERLQARLRTLPAAVQ